MTLGHALGVAFAATIIAALATHLVINLPNALQDHVAMAQRSMESGLGGYDGTLPLYSLRDDLAQAWTAIPDPATKEQIILTINGKNGVWQAMGSWDIDPLYGDRKYEWTDAGSGATAHATLTFKERVYPIAEVNYVLFGLVNRLAYDEGILPNLTSKYAMADTVHLYRSFGGGLTSMAMWKAGKSTKYETIIGKVAWARFGWEWAGDANANPPIDMPNAKANGLPYPHGPLNYNISFGQLVGDGNPDN